VTLQFELIHQNEWMFFRVNLFILFIEWTKWLKKRFIRYDERQKLLFKWKMGLITVFIYFLSCGLGACLYEIVDITGMKTVN